MANYEKNDYRFEIPDYVLGKTPPDVTAIIESLMANDLEFKAEVESFQNIMGDLDAFKAEQKVVFEAELPKDYFTDFSNQVLNRVHQKPFHQSFWEELKSSFNALLSPAPISELSTAISGFMILAVLFSFIFTFHAKSPTYSSRIESDTSFQDDSYSLISALEFTQGRVSESLLFSLSGDDADKMIESLNKTYTSETNILNVEESYDVLTSEEAEELLKYL